MCMTINHFEFKIIFSPEHIAITAPISSLSTNFDNKVTIGVLVRPPEWYCIFKSGGQYWSVYHSALYVQQLSSLSYVPIEDSPVARYIIQPCVARAQTMKEVTQLKAPIMPIIGSWTFNTLVMRDHKEPVTLFSVGPSSEWAESMRWNAVCVSINLKLSAKWKERSRSQIIADLCFDLSTLLRNGVTIQALVKPWMVSTCYKLVHSDTYSDLVITSSGGAYRLVESESLLIPAKFLSGVQVQAVLKIIIAKNT